MAIWRAIQDKPANSYVLKWRYNLASPDRDALMNGRFAPEAAVHVVGGTGWPAVRTTPVGRTSRFGSFVPTSDIACRERLSFGGKPAADGAADALLRPTPNDNRCRLVHLVSPFGHTNRTSYPTISPLSSARVRCRSAGKRKISQRHQLKTDCPRSRPGGTARSSCRPDRGSSISAPRFQVLPAQDPRARPCFADHCGQCRYRRPAG